jgi:branched-chain amino acid transport system permease protein
VDEFLQFLFSGLTRGSIYAMVGIGFAIVYNASHVINFAQGEFVMIGGMAAVFVTANAGLPLIVAIPVALSIAAIVGVLLEKFAVEPARGASVVTLIIITIGASIFIRGAVEVFIGKRDYALPAFSGDAPIHVGGATLHPQSLWIMGALIAVTIGLKLFFDFTRLGKAMIATSHNRLAAQLAGIEVRHIMLAAFALSAMLGALAGLLTAPITLTRFDIGIMLGLKGFCAAILGGLGSPYGAVAGGLALGLAEAMTGGYVSSAYQDAVAFAIILAVLFVRPQGLFGRGQTERV